jgi:hypothetical protein
MIESPERCQLQQQTGGNNCRFRCGRLQSSNKIRVNVAMEVLGDMLWQRKATVNRSNDP